MSRFLPIARSSRHSTRKIVSRTDSDRRGTKFTLAWFRAQIDNAGSSAGRSLRSRSSRLEFRRPIRNDREATVLGGSRFPILFFSLFFFFAYSRAFPFPVCGVLFTQMFLFKSFNCQFSPSSSIRILLTMSGSKLDLKFHIHVYIHACVRACDRHDQTHLAYTHI